MKAEARRAAILDLLADHVIAEGLGGSSLRPMAKAAGISDRMLLYYFKDKAEVIGAALEVIARRNVVILDARVARETLPLDALRARIAALVLADEMWPYMRVWLEVASFAGRGDSVCRDVGERIARGFLAWGEAQLDSPTPEDRATDAAKLFVSIEGIVLLKSLGLEDVAALAV